MNCPVCGSAVTAGTRFCGTCGADVSNLTMTGGMTGFGEATALPPVEYGGFWIRLVASIIDGIILGVVGFILGLIFGSDSTGQGISGVINLVIGWLYAAYFWSSARQATPGKMAMGLRVTDEAGQRISFGRATGRYFAQILSAIALGLGYIWIAFDKRKQGWHDKLAHTLVVKKR